MQSWMIGTGLAVLAMGWSGDLPGLEMLCLGLLAGALLYWLRPGAVAGCLLGIACGSAWATGWGQLLLEQRLP